VTTTVLVTGATGYIGGHCVQDLLEHGFAVRGTVRDLTRAQVSHLHELADRTGGSLELVEASLTADRGWPQAVEGCSYVWHVASPAPARCPGTRMN
jgi:dihydroflavonol-4-reductase